MIDPKLIELARNRSAAWSAGHGLDHIERVIGLSLWLCDQLDEELDRELVILIALLHDIDDSKMADDRVLSRWLKEYEPMRAELVAREIGLISYRNGGVPLTREGQIVQDADRLDALGAIGLIRMVQYGEWKGYPLLAKDGEGSGEEHLHQKLKHLPQKMNTKVAQQRAKILIERLETIMEWVVEEDDVRINR